MAGGCVGAPLSERSESGITGWIRDHVKGRTFADVGGIGMRSTNERVTLALSSGATAATMIDIRPKEYYEWTVFRDKCRQSGVPDTAYSCIDAIDINDAALKDKVGVFDFVHSTGINYHLPNPVWGVHNLRRIVGEYLITNTVIMPETVETPEGTLHFPGSQAVFMPGLTERERRILDAYYQKKLNASIDYMAPRLDAENPSCPWYKDGEPTCWPFWWLMTVPAFEGLIRLVGFEILDTHLWNNHAYAVLCRRTERP